MKSLQVCGSWWAGRAFGSLGSQAEPAEPGNQEVVINKKVSCARILCFHFLAPIFLPQSMVLNPAFFIRPCR